MVSKLTEWTSETCDSERSKHMIQLKLPVANMTTPQSIQTNRTETIIDGNWWWLMRGTHLLRLKTFISIFNVQTWATVKALSAFSKMNCSKYRTLFQLFFTKFSCCHISKINYISWNSCVINRDFFLLLLIITQFPGWLSSPLPFNIYYSCLKCPIHRMCGGRYDEKSHYFIQTFFEALNFFQNPFTFPVVLPWSELMKACVSVEIARNSESSINYEERLNWPRENVVIWSYLWIFL